MSKGRSSKLSRRLIRRLRNELGLDIPEDTPFYRTYSGHWQRKRGAWSWWFSVESGPLSRYQIGSPYSMTYLMKYPKLCVYTDKSLYGPRILEILPDGILI